MTGIVVTSAGPPFCPSSQQQIIQRHAPRRQITFCGCSNFPCQINPHSKSTDIILYSTACGVCPMSIPCLLALRAKYYGRRGTGWDPTWRSEKGGVGAWYFARSSRRNGCVVSLQRNDDLWGPPHATRSQPAVGDFYNPCSYRGRWKTPGRGETYFFNRVDIRVHLTVCTV